MRVKPAGPEVYFSQDPLVPLAEADIAELTGRLPQGVRNRVRLCTHPDTTSTFHEMFIAFPRGTYVRPHKHLDRSKSYHMIAGTLDVLVHHDDGRLREVHSLGPFGSGAPFYLRVTEHVYHTVFITSELAVFHEATSGPLVRENTLNPDWSPPESDLEASARYMKDLAAALGSFRSAPREPRDWVVIG